MDELIEDDDFAEFMHRVFSILPMHSEESQKGFSFPFQAAAGENTCMLNPTSENHVVQADTSGILPMISVESQEEFSFPSQAGASSSMLNQARESCVVQADTSSDGKSFVSPYSFGRPGTSQPQNIPHTGKKLVGTATNRIYRKRLNDKLYRERIKEGKRKLEDDSYKLCEENAYLKSENESLKEEKDMMNKNFQSATDEIKQLKLENCKLKRNSSNLEILMDAVVKKLINEDHQLERTQLKNEMPILSQNSTSGDRVTENKQLLKRNQELEHQIKVLKFQNEALCERMSNDK